MCDKCFMKKVLLARDTPIISEVTTLLIVMLLNGFYSMLLVNSVPRFFVRDQLICQSISLLLMELIT